VRLSPGRDELLWGEEVWAELERRGARFAFVPFSGRAGRGGSTGTITLSHRTDGDRTDVEAYSGRDELTYALEGPVWDRYGTFAGHPTIRGTVVWCVADRSVVIAGTRGGARFEERIA
jgi:hypothetical protein